MFSFQFNLYKDTLIFLISFICVLLGFYVSPGNLSYFYFPSFQS